MLTGWRTAETTRLSHAVAWLACCTQVALNQLVLGPVVVSAVFTWSLGWSNRLAELPTKLRRDTLPTLRKGWAFWVPASSINFACVAAGRCVAPWLPFVAVFVG